MAVTEKIKRSPKIFVLLGFSLLLLLIVSLNIASMHMSKAQTMCMGGNVYMYGNNTGTTTGISGIANITVGLPTSTAGVPSKILVFLDNQLIGQARPQTSSSYQWIMQVPAGLLDPRSTGSQLKAVLKYQNFQCETPVTTTPPILPTTSMGLLVQPSTTLVELPVNNQRIVSASVMMPDGSSNFSQFAVYDWAAESRGVIDNSQNKEAMFFSGPNIGDGRIKARVTFGKRIQDIFITTRVVATNSPIIEPTTTATDPITNQGITKVDDTSTQTSLTPKVAETGTVSNTSTQTIQPTAALQANSATKDCTISVLGEERFAAINGGTARPSLSELEKLKACFARTNYIIPSNFAPISPKEVSSLPTAQKAKIAELTNEKKQVGDSNKDVLKLKGIAAQNSTVIIYIYSEPLVLTTTADGNGEWTYELESALASGDHTMYAVVDRGDGVYEKTEPFKFAIGKAEASAENPEGLSLVLNETETAKDSMMGTVLYISSTLILLLAIGAVAFIAYSKGRHSHAFHYGHEGTSDALATSPSQPTTDEVPPATIIVPESQPIKSTIITADANEASVTETDDVAPKVATNEIQPENQINQQISENNDEKQ